MEVLMYLIFLFLFVLWNEYFIFNFNLIQINIILYVDGNKYDI